MTDETPTAERLAAALEEAGLPPELVERARAAEFDDYRSPHAMPLITLVSELRAIGTPAAAGIIQRVIEGEFDGTKAEADAWAASPEGRATFAELVGGNRAARRARRRHRR